MDLSSTKSSFIKQLGWYSLIEKIFLWYSVLLIVLLVVLPLFETGSLGGSATQTYWFFNPWMIKTNILALLLLSTLLLRNLSSHMRQKIYQRVGFRSSDAFINFVLIFGLIMLFFGMSDTVSVFSNNFSQMIGTTASFSILLLYLIGWLVLSLIVSYTHTSKSSHPHEDIHIPNHQEKAEAEAFKKVEQEFSGLFKDQKPVDPTPPPTAHSSRDFVR